MATLLVLGHALVPNGDLHGPGPVSFGLKIYNARGKILFAGRTTVRLYRDDINGHGCGPIVWQGNVTASGTHTLVVDD